METWLNDRKTEAPIAPNAPRLIGVAGKPGIEPQFAVPRYRDFSMVAQVLMRDGS